MTPDQKFGLRQVIDFMAGQFAPMVVPIFCAKEKGGLEARAVGTGFIYGNQRYTFLITSNHVIEDLKREGGEPAAIINKKFIFLGGLNYWFEKENDFAVSELSKSWLDENGLSGMPVIRAPEGDGWKPTPNFILMGYPATQKNMIRFTPNRDVFECQIMWISTELDERNQTDKDIKDAIVFRADERNFVDTMGQKRGGVPPLKGMSGGPAFQLLYNPALASTDTCPGALMFVGVLNRWRREKRAVAATDGAYVLEWIMGRMAY